MTALEELIKYLTNFTSDQIEKFLHDNVTLSILQPEAVTGSDRPSTPEYEQ